MGYALPSGRCTLAVGAPFGWGTCNQPQPLASGAGFFVASSRSDWCGDAWQQASLLVSWLQNRVSFEPGGLLPPPTQTC